MTRFIAAAVLMSGLGAALVDQHPVAARQGEKGEAGGPEVGRKAYAFLKKYCSRCHKADNPPSEIEDYDVLSYESLTKKRTDDGKDWFYVKPGLKGEKALRSSHVWLHAGKKGVAGAQEGEHFVMPPRTFRKKKVEPQPTDAEREKVLGAWIAAGAPKAGFGPP